MIKILFAHPDRKLIQLYHPALSRHFSVDSAHDGLTALRKLKLTVPGLVIADYDLPHLSGAALLRFARSSSEHSRTPFIFLTTAIRTHQALGLGANDWLELTKATPDLLVERIWNQLKLQRYGV